MTRSERRALRVNGSRTAWHLAFLGILVLGTGCQGDIGDVAPPDGPPPPAPSTPFEPLAAGLRTLTPAQYAASVSEVLGLDTREGTIEPFGQWASSIGAARGGFSATTVETYEVMARDAAHFMFEDETRRDAFIGCVPSPDCSRSFIARVGRRAFRRSLSQDEVGRWAGVADSLGASLGDAYRGLELALSGLLQSPHFLYRIELGEADLDSERLAYTNHEMATRLAFLVWNQTPDEALLDMADVGALDTEAGVAAQVRIMLADPRARRGLHGFLSELLDTAAIEELEKNPEEYPLFDEALAMMMREQLERTASNAVGGEGYRALFTTRDTFANARLGEVMDIDVASGDVLEPIRLPDESPRAGVLTMPGYLALHAYPGKTSPALRGLFLRTRLLCQEIPPPPAGTDTTLPERAPGELVTTRELVALHQESDTCAACHRLMDPIGLGLEEFDAIGQHRETENGLDIDPSGVLEGRPFADAAELGEVVALHPRLLPCLVANLYAYGAANTIDDNDPALEPLVAGLIEDDFASAIVAVATSEHFRFAYPEDSP